MCVSDSAAALDWYVAVFDAVETVRYVGDDGRIGHAEVSIGSARLMLSDAYPEIGVVDPQTLGGTPFTLNLNVDDVDAVWAWAIEHGAQRRASPRRSAVRGAVVHVPRPVRTPLVGADDDQPPDARRDRRGDGGLHRGDECSRAPTGPLAHGSRRARILHDGLHRHGDRITLLPGAVRLADRAGELGAEYAHVNNTQLPLGFTPEGVDSPPVLYFRVPDAESYAARVPGLGGTVVSEATYDSGGSVVCRDDQGREFQLWQPAPGY